MSEQNTVNLKKDIDPEVLKEAEKGPLQDRECRDTLCCLLFIANIGAMIYVAIWGFTTGSTYNIYRGTDSLANACNTTAYPYLYFNAPFGINFLTNRICVKTCPTASDTSITCKINTNTPSCGITFDLDSQPNNSNWLSSVTANPGPDFILKYSSTVFIQRVCIPSTTTYDKFSAALQSNFSTLVSAQIGNSTYISNAVSDFKNGWPMIIAAAGIAFALSFCYMCVMKCCAGVLIWFSLFGSVISLAGLGAVLYVYSGQLQGISTGIASLDTYVAKASVSSTVYQNYKYFAYAIWGIAGLALILIFCMCSRIKLAIAITKAAGQFVSSTLSVLSVPIISTCLTAIIWVLGIIGAIFVISAASFVPQSGSIFTSISSYQDPAMLRLYFFFFAVLWVDAFTSAFSFFIIACSTVFWYYSHGSQQMTHTPLLTSIWWAFRYHGGSLAFGSLLVAIIQFLRVVYQFIAEYLQKQNPGNKLVECLLCIGRCCLACLQCIIQFINKNGYITIAITGKNFCYAAKQGFQIAWSNPLRFLTLNGVGRAVSFVGCLLISSGSVIIFYLLIQYTSYKSVIQMPYLMMLVVFLIAWVISLVFIYVFTAAMDTIIICFILDEEVMKGSGKPAKYAPKELAQILQSNRE